MLDDLDIPFDRITYRDGQLLTARDLNDEQRRHARLRAAHNQYLHGTWGIALGFQVQPMTGNHAVVVGAGYAIDAEGRDIVLSKTLALPVPDVGGPEVFVLTATFNESESSPRRRQIKGACQGDSDGERLSFQWQQARGARFGQQVPLVAVTVAQGTIQGALNLRVRRYARTDSRPHVNVETTEAGQTGWQVWGASQGQTFGLEIVVDTTEAGFHQTPQYFAVLHGDFSNQPNEAALFTAPGWPSGSPVGFSPGTFGFITDASAESFTYRVTCVGQPPFSRSLTPAEAESRRWHIAWLGLEAVTGGEPTLDLIKLFLLSATF
jgi:hypothetical protein